MTEREYRDYLNDMIEAADMVASFIEGITKDQFLSDKKTQFAVVRALEIIGEASKKVPESIRTYYPDLPWKEIGGMRDKLIHDYFGVNDEVVWETAVNDVPVIAARLKQGDELNS